MAAEANDEEEYNPYSTANSQYKREDSPKNEYKPTYEEEDQYKTSYDAPVQQPSAKLRFDDEEEEYKPAEFHNV